MIIIFDLDDTLYRREDFVNNGLKNVANIICSKNKKYKINQVYLNLKKLYKNPKVKNIFNYFLKENNINNLSKQKCLSVYRYGTNKLKLYPQALNLLKAYTKKCYLITDGNKNVQRYKIKQLKIKKYFKKIFITNVYGIKYQKPSIYCFEKIKKIEKCDFKNMVYIGDNPNKDFIGCNMVGIKTIRLQKGEFKNLVKKFPYEAKYRIKNLNNLENILSLFS
ncbi:HAD hydrolase-like protein [Candidatus Pelagibacter bacterium]|nr:HAD hydrolase-like protein [Candidatus Pelagibacter bacterium]